MKDRENDFDEEKIDGYYEDEETKRKFPSFILLCLITTFGVLTPLGISLSIFKYMESNESINTLISSLTGDDNKGKYIITYVENTGQFNDNIKNNTLHISSAEFDSGTKGGKGEVIYYGGLLITTKNTFPDKSSTITYKLTITNDSLNDKTFNDLIYDKEGNVKYTISGIKTGDVVKSGESKTVYLTLEYTGDPSKIPSTIESSSSLSFDENNKTIHIIDANYDSSNDDKSTGEVVYYNGLMLTTKTTLDSPTSTVTYKVIVKNDGDETKTYTGIDFNNNGDVKYTVTGIKEGDILKPGESKVVYVTVENNGDNKPSDYPKTVESTSYLEFTDFGTNYSEYGIYLLNQFPTKDEVGKLFEGKNYTFNFSLILGKKTVGAYYEITAVENESNNLNPSYVKLYLEKNKTATDFSLRTNGKVKTFNEYSKSDYPEASGKVIHKGYITQDDVNRGKIDFTLRMWISEDVKVNENNISEFNNKKFAVKVNTYATFTKGD